MYVYVCVRGVCVCGWVGVCDSPLLFAQNVVTLTMFLHRWPAPAQMAKARRSLISLVLACAFPPLPFLLGLIRCSVNYLLYYCLLYDCMAVVVVVVVVAAV